MNKAAVLSSPIPRDANPESDVHKISRSAGNELGVNIVDLAAAIAAPSRRLEIAPCVERATAALEHAAAGDVGRARRAAEDAFIMISALAHARRERDRFLAARAALSAGDAFLLLDDATSAAECFEIAARFFDARHDIIRAAQAERGLVHARSRLQAGTLDDVPEEP
jgi:hypothetical protein